MTWAVNETRILCPMFRPSAHRQYIGTGEYLAGNHSRSLRPEVFESISQSYTKRGTRVATTGGRIAAPIPDEAQREAKNRNGFARVRESRAKSSYMVAKNFPCAFSYGTGHLYVSGSLSPRKPNRAVHEGRIKILTSPLLYQCLSKANVK